MRWERLFDDIEAVVMEEERHEHRLEVADRIRHERAQVALIDRIAASTRPVEMLLANRRRVAGLVRDSGADWFSLESADQRQWLVPLTAVAQVTGLGREVGSATRLSRRFSLGYALRALARSRTPIQLDDRVGRTLSGTIDVVGADALDLSEHPLDVPRRHEQVLAVRVVPFSAIVCLGSTS